MGNVMLRRQWCSLTIGALAHPLGLGAMLHPLALVAGCLDNGLSMFCFGSKYLSCHL
jgi:hypothetical protein